MNKKEKSKLMSMTKKDLVNEINTLKQRNDAGVGVVENLTLSLKRKTDEFDALNERLKMSMLAIKQLRRDKDVSSTKIKLYKEEIIHLYDKVITLDAISELDSKENTGDSNEA